MPKFGESSKSKLQSCVPELQQVANKAIEVVDFSILVGHRGKADQEKAFAEGRSKLNFPESNHNSQPSKAFDFAPYPQGFANTESTADPKKRMFAMMRFAFIAGVLVGIGHALGIKLRSGLDWNRNGNSEDERFLDAPHIEIDDK